MHASTSCTPGNASAGKPGERSAKKEASNDKARTAAAASLARLSRTSFFLYTFLSLSFVASVCGVRYVTSGTSERARHRIGNGLGTALFSSGTCWQAMSNTLFQPGPSDDAHKEINQ